MGSVRKQNSQAAKDYSSLLKDFVDGRLELASLAEAIDNRLFELRKQSPEMTEAERFLSPIELLICEVRDGFRPVTELKEYARSLISGRKPVHA